MATQCNANQGGEEAEVHDPDRPPVPRVRPAAGVYASSASAESVSVRTRNRVTSRAS